MRINRILGISLTENTLFEPRFCVFLRRIQYSKDHSLLEYSSHSSVKKNITHCKDQPDTLFTTVVLLPNLGFSYLIPHKEYRALRMRIKRD